MIGEEEVHMAGRLVESPLPSARSGVEVASRGSLQRVATVCSDRRGEVRGVQDLGQHFSILWNI